MGAKIATLLPPADRQCKNLVCFAHVVVAGAACFFFTGSSLYKGGSGSDSTTLLDAVIPLLVYYSIYYLPVYSIGIYYLPVYSIYYVLVYNIYSTCEDNE